MTLGALPRTATAILIAAGMTTGAVAQPADEQEDTYETRHSRMMDGMDEGPMMGMHGHRGAHRGMMMKIMFTIADTNGDGALSLDEVSAIHKRIFDGADANKDGKLTRDEIRAFVRD